MRLNTTTDVKAYVDARHEAIQERKNDKRTEREQIADLKAKRPKYEALDPNRYYEVETKVIEREVYKPTFSFRNDYVLV